MSDNKGKLYVGYYKYSWELNINAVFVLENIFKIPQEISAETTETLLDPPLSMLHF